MLSLIHAFDTRKLPAVSYGHSGIKGELTLMLQLNTPSNQCHYFYSSCQIHKKRITRRPLLLPRVSTRQLLCQCTPEKKPHLPTATAPRRDCRERLDLVMYSFYNSNYCFAPLNNFLKDFAQTSNYRTSQAKLYLRIQIKRCLILGTVWCTCLTEFSYGKSVFPFPDNL